MGIGELARRLAGWCCLGMVAVFVLLGYYFGNIRFAPLAVTGPQSLKWVLLSVIWAVEPPPAEPSTNVRTPPP